jgi:hypothetical protein
LFSVFLSLLHSVGQRSNHAYLVPETRYYPVKILAWESPSGLWPPLLKWHLKRTVKFRANVTFLKFFGMLREGQNTNDTIFVVLSPKYVKKRQNTPP